jgi:hypothetical protein
MSIAMFFSSKKANNSPEHGVNIDNLTFNDDGTARLNIDNQETQKEIWSLIQQLENFPIAKTTRTDA